VAIRVQRRSGVPFAIVTSALFILLLGVNLGTPLYAVYEQRFGFGAGTVTLIFGTYAAVLVPSLLLFGQVSDRVGRRRTIVAGLIASLGGLALFAAADGTGWLLTARAVQGLAVGAVSGSATAALVELEPRGDGAQAALFSTLAQAGGCAAGPLLAGVLVQWAPAPRELCFLVGIVLTLGAIGAVLTTAETAPPGRGRSFTAPHVPRAIRSSFTRAGLTGAAVWAVAALFLSVVPSYASDLLDSDNRALFGAIAALMLGTSCVAQFAARDRRAPRATQAAGLIVLAAGLAALVTAFPTRSLVLVLASALLAGAGHGLGFAGAQEEINEIAPPARRGEVTSAFYTCIYGGVAVSIIGLGLLPLSLSDAVAVFASVIGGTALLTSAWHRRA
jgi:MFS family permease